jgi:hypothetical protein
MGDAESQAELRGRAEALRSAAQRARTAAQGLGMYLDGTFKAYSTPRGANSDQEGAQGAFLLHIATSADPH